MNRRTVIIAAVAGVATVVITAALTGGQSSSLPVPHTVVVTPTTTKSKSPGSGKNTSTSTTSSPSGIQGGVTTTTLAQLTTCVISVSNSSPRQGNTAETVTVTAVPEAYVSITAHYPHATSKHNGSTGTSASIAFQLPIAHSPVGTTVVVSGSASLEATRQTCIPASFTPVP